MRDYSFGNFISALRERCGISQYQLGALVGVSDKAVSKWENGASKPRIAIIKKLSEVLDVSIDELLTCEYKTFNTKRKDLFAMKKEIISIAKDKMKVIYGENPPIEISNRFKTEELMLYGQETLLWMGFLGKMQGMFCEEKAYFDVRDPQMGASFISWLLNATDVNPLPSHYYCPICKKVEFVLDVKCGIDLVDKKCTCGSDYKKDGFGIDAVNMYPFSKCKEIHVSKNGTELVKKSIKDYFDGYGKVQELKIVYDESVEVHPLDEIIVTKFGIFSSEICKGFSDREGVVTYDEYLNMRNDVMILNVVENAEEKISRQDLSNIEFSQEQIRAYFEYAKENGMFDNCNDGMRLDKVLSGIKNPRFVDLLAIYGIMHSSGVWKENEEILYDKGIALDELIYCREDVYDYVYNKIKVKCCENPLGQAFEIKEAVRKGRYSNNRMPVEIERLLLECAVPEWYVDSMKKILYLFPKTHLVVLLKRDMCKFVNMNN